MPDIRCIAVVGTGAMGTGIAQIAAQAGLDWARYNLANLHATGRGVSQDQPRAYALYRQAAEQGHAKSMNL
ncbi:3-hydroxyacyl-CoA dehydrogenase NAD-binding domain-containing protein, partial [Klebsiella pneumoniae]